MGTRYGKMVDHEEMEADDLGLISIESEPSVRPVDKHVFDIREAARNGMHVVDYPDQSYIQDDVEVRRMLNRSH